MFISQSENTQGLGICNVRLIIKEPDTANSNTRGWNCPGPMSVTPNQSLFPIAPFTAAMAMSITSNNELGIGVPSKYLRALL
jgi:hypothetical protein